jgi:TPR repeat protein
LPVVLFAADASAAPQVDIKELTAKAEAGDGEAQFKLGARYYRGRDVPQDYEKAVFWWKKSAESGVPAAQFFLGECYAQGKGVQKDEKKAVSYISVPPKRVLICAT